MIRRSNIGQKWSNRKGVGNNYKQKNRLELLRQYILI